MQQNCCHSFFESWIDRSQMTLTSKDLKSFAQLNLLQLSMLRLIPAHVFDEIQFQDFHNYLFSIYLHHFLQPLLTQITFNSYENNIQHRIVELFHRFVISPPSFGLALFITSVVVQMLIYSELELVQFQIFSPSVLGH